MCDVNKVKEFITGILCYTTASFSTSLCEMLLRLMLELKFLRQAAEKGGSGDMGRTGGDGAYSMSWSPEDRELPECCVQR